VDENSDWQLAVRRMTAFSDEEEAKFGTVDSPP
jgi:hypothetical protein